MIDFLKNINIHTIFFFLIILVMLIVVFTGLIIILKMLNIKKVKIGNTEIEAEKENFDKIKTKEELRKIITKIENIKHFFSIDQIKISEKHGKVILKEIEEYFISLLKDYLFKQKSFFENDIKNLDELSDLDWLKQKLKELNSLNKEKMQHFIAVNGYCEMDDKQFNDYITDKSCLLLDFSLSFFKQAYNSNVCFMPWDNFLTGLKEKIELSFIYITKAMFTEIRAYSIDKKRELYELEEKYNNL